VFLVHTTQHNSVHIPFQIMQQNKRKEAFDELTIPVPQNMYKNGQEDRENPRDAVASAKASGGRLFAVKQHFAELFIQHILYFIFQ
jgi:hypothetical protein